VQGVQTYRVFSLNGTLVGSVDAVSTYEVQFKVRAMVSEKGVYLIRGQNGLTRRVLVTK
jgi:hypothetical protein